MGEGLQWFFSTIADLPGGGEVCNGGKVCNITPALLWSQKSNLGHIKPDIMINIFCKVMEYPCA